MKGRDLILQHLKEFLDRCGELDIKVMVESKRGTRPFKIEAEGTAYTPKSKDCPIQRLPSETTEEFFARWNAHLSGIFQPIVHDLIQREIGLSVDEYRKGIEAEKQAGSTSFGQYLMGLHFAPPASPTATPPTRWHTPTTARNPVGTEGTGGQGKAPSIVDHRASQA